MICHDCRHVELDSTILVPLGLGWCRIEAATWLHAAGSGCTDDEERVMAGLMHEDDVGEARALLVAGGLSEEDAEARVSVQEAQGYADKGIDAERRRGAFAGRLAALRKSGGDAAADAWREAMVARIKALAA